MKKIFLAILLILNVYFYNILFVNAKNSFKIISIIDKCQIVENNITIIPIKVFALKEGKMSKVITEYKLGEIEILPSTNYEIMNLSSKYVKNIKIDVLKSSDNKSNIYYYIDEDVDLKLNETLMTFELKIKLNSDEVSTINILNNEIVLSNQKTCQEVNNYEPEIKNNYIEVQTASKDVDKKENKSLEFFVIILLSIYFIYSIYRKHNKYIKKG